MADLFDLMKNQPVLGFARQRLERVRKTVADPTLDVGDVIFCQGFYMKVESITRYAPGKHPEGAIVREDYIAIEIKTAIGSRWYGVPPKN